MLERDIDPIPPEVLSEFNLVNLQDVSQIMMTFYCSHYSTFSLFC